MIRKIIKIDKERCNGCGLCATACHEGAIGMVEGKATLLREDYCDGLGDCLPACPTGAITFEEREAPAYDHAAVMAAKAKQQNEAKDPKAATHLQNWPVQIKLAPVSSDMFAGCDLLVAADCTAFAYGNFHSEFMRGRVTLVGCPKLDGVNYAEKLAAILKVNEIKSVTLVKMQVPCCGGLALAVQKAIAASGKKIPLQIVTVSTKGELL